LPAAVDEIQTLNPFRRDRFLDSLYIVRVIHMLGIQVHVMPYEHNYMANFEVEIFEETSTGDPILVHHLFDTEIYCAGIEEDPKCVCVYNNEHAFGNSKIIKKLQLLVTNGYCLAIAGYD